MRESENYGEKDKMETDVSMFHPTTLTERRRRHQQQELKVNIITNREGQTGTDRTQRGGGGGDVQYLKAPRIVSIMKDTDHLVIQLQTHASS